MSDQHDKITVTPVRPPNYDTKNYSIELIRVLPKHGPHGEPSVDRPTPGPEDDPFDFVLQTIDYWKFSCQHPTNPNETMSFMTLEFLPESDSDKINTSMILWESEQLAETMFSWTGCIFREIKKPSEDPVPPPLKISFDDVVKDIVRKESLSVDVDNAVFEQGKLVISLHRSDRIPYIRRGNTARDKLSADLIVLLRDQQGNPHYRRISFLAAGTGRRHRLMHTLFTP
jgi:hypothetical protein